MAWDTCYPMRLRRKRPRVHLDELPPELESGQRVGLDVEVYGLQSGRMHRPGGRFASLQVAVGDDVYVVRDQKLLRDAFRRIRKGDWTFFHAEFDLRQLRQWVPVSYLRPPVSRFWDVMLVDQLLWSGYYKDFSLADTVRRYFGRYLDKSTRDLFPEADEMTPEMVRYGAEDAWYTLKCREVQERILDEGHPVSDSFDYLWRKVEGPMVFVLLDWRGAYIDVDRWLQVAEGYAAQVKEMQKRLDYNPGSWQQVVARIRQEGFRVSNAQAATMEALAAKSEVARTRLAYMKAQKRASTYGENWIKQHVEADGRVYSDYHQIGTVTGRLASSSPNLQNIPIREGPEYRRCFVHPEQRGRLVVGDFEQQEIRFTAYKSQDRALLDAVRSGRNVHAAVASLIFEQPVSKGMDEYRLGKAVNLGLTYGLTPRGLARNANIPVYRAEALVRKYFDTFPGVSTWMRRERAWAEQCWYVQSVAGRVCWVNLYDRGWINRAVNYPIQSSGGDQLKRSMVLLRERCLADLGYRVGEPLPLVLTVHDELVLEPPVGQVREHVKAFKEAVYEASSELCPGLEFPLDVATGRSWAVKK